MVQFLENNFHFIALFLTVLTGGIFVTLLLLKQKEEYDNRIKLHIISMSVVTVYEVIQILLLVFVCHNVILRIYSAFLGFSIALLLYIEIVYLISFVKLSKKNKNKPTEEIA